MLASEKASCATETGVKEINHQRLTIIKWLDGIVVKVRPNRYGWKNVLDSSILVMKGKRLLYAYKQTWIAEYFEPVDFPYAGCRSLIIRTSRLGSAMPDVFVILVKFPTGKYMVYPIDWIWSEDSTKMICNLGNDAFRELRLVFGSVHSCSDRLYYDRLLVFDRALESWRFDRIVEFPEFYRSGIEAAEKRIRGYPAECRAGGEEACDPHDLFQAVFDLAYRRLMMGRPIEGIEEKVLERSMETDEERECVQSMISEAEDAADERRSYLAAKPLQMDVDGGNGPRRTSSGAAKGLRRGRP
jgi:hypothetical protein